MANIQINELPLVDTATADDVLIINVNNTVTSAIKFSDFSADLNIFTKPGYFPDGTAISPSISFTNDQNTGFFRPGNDQVGVTTAGVQRAVVNGTGNVGINVNDPLSRLHVRGDSRFDVSDSASLMIASDLTSSEVFLGTLTATPFLFGVNSSEKMRLSSTGSLLVGTTTNASTSTMVVGGQVDVQGALISNGGTTDNLLVKNSSVDFVQFNAAGAASFGGSYGTDGLVLVSSGPDAPPIWGNVETDPTVFDFRELPNIING
jgi:hypothetical protein